MNLENQLLDKQQLENQLLEKFQVEELEKRYEFLWIHFASGQSPAYGDPFGPYDTWYGIGISFP